MNMLILEPDESGKLLPRDDRRWEHLKKILRKTEGDSVSAGCTDGMVGKARILRLDDSGLILDFEAENPSEPPYPVRLILGFPRPIQAGRILKDLTSLGVSEISLIGTELGEKSYTQSDIFRKKEFRRPLVEGAEQAGSPRLPEVTTYWTLTQCLDALCATPGARIAFHPGPSSPQFGQMDVSSSFFTLAIGSERGWTEREIATLTERGFVTASLGSRILKTETAANAAVVLALAKMGLI